MPYFSRLSQLFIYVILLLQRLVAVQQTNSGGVPDQPVDKVGCGKLKAEKSCFTEKAMFSQAKSMNVSEGKKFL